jgi:hypothetical protein
MPLTAIYNQEENEYQNNKKLHTVGFKISA